MGDADTFINLLKGGGVLGLLAFICFLLWRGDFRLSREDKATSEHHAARIADRDREIARLEKEIDKLILDRDRWIEVNFQNAPVIAALKDALVEQTKAMEEMRGAVEDLAAKGKQG